MIGKKKIFVIGMVFLLSNIGLFLLVPVSKSEIPNEESDHKVIISLQINNPYKIKNPENNDVKSNNICSESVTFEKSIPLEMDLSDTLIKELEELNKKIECSASNEEIIRLYSQGLEFFRSHDMIPDSFTIENLYKTTEEMVSTIHQKDMIPDILQKRMVTNNIPPKNVEDMDDVVSLENNVEPGEFRLDVGSGFFLLTFLSEMTPWNIVPNPPGVGDAFEFNLTDFTLGQTLAEMWPRLENYTFLVGVGGGIGYAELISIPGNALIGGQALFSWPQAIPMNLFIYRGSSLIIPIGYVTGFITILLDRGPRDVPIPLIDLAVVASILTVHMPYSRGPN